MYVRDPSVEAQRHAVLRATAEAGRRSPTGGLAVSPARDALVPPPHVYVRDLACRWHFLASSFTHYFRLLTRHLGLPGWQLAFTPMGLDPATRFLLNLFSPERVQIDLVHQRMRRAWARGGDGAALLAARYKHTAARRKQRRRRQQQHLQKAKKKAAQAAGSLKENKGKKGAGKASKRVRPGSAVSAIFGKGGRARRHSRPFTASRTRTRSKGSTADTSSDSDGGGSADGGGRRL